MIIQLEYQDIDLVGIKTNYNGKVKSHYIRYIVDEFSIDSALKDAETNKWIVALDYQGDYQYLYNFNKEPKIPVIVTKELKEINEMTVSFCMSMLPNWVIVVIKTPKDFHDMKMIECLSKKYKNIRFCGGKFLRLPCCSIGCIQREDIPSKIPESKISYYTEGCACIMPTLPLEEVEGVDMLFKDKEEEKKIEKEENKKKIISSIEDLLSL